MTEVRHLPYGVKAEMAYDARLAMEEASRCLLCEDAPCSRDCPAGTDPGRFIRAIRFRNFKGAAKTIRENNILGASCAEICPFHKLCESACSRTGIDRPIRIGKLQAFAMEQEKAFGMQTLVAGKATGKKVLCIGAGPASLAVAAKLAQMGVAVKIIDENAKPGGVLRYGITPSRLGDDIVDQDIAAVRSLGVEFELGRRVHGNELAELRKQYDAVFIGVGMSDSKQIMSLPGRELKGCESAVAFLKRARSSGGKIDHLGRVVIIGGGDVAMDCASTSKQLGADSVHVTFIETLENMPANKPELDYVISLGVPVMPAFMPTEVVGKDKVEGVQLLSMDKASNLYLKADTVVFAVGQRVSDDYQDLPKGEGFFVGGDLANGGKTVVHAVADGKRVAVEIAEFLHLVKPA